MRQPARARLVGRYRERLAGLYAMNLVGEGASGRDREEGGDDREDPEGLAHRAADPNAARRRVPSTSLRRDRAVGSILRAP